MIDNPVILDGNQAASMIAHQINEVIAIYPITPSSPMGELADEWSSLGHKNLWGEIPEVIEMQSEGGAAGAVHGALQAGALTTTFTSSQGLLLMIPNMYKIAGELTPAVFHIAARSLACQALSIFGDHSDVMAVRQTGFALLASNSVQEVHDMALISQAITLASRIPVAHFFDGFRTSHEVSKIEGIPQEVIRTMIDDELVEAQRKRAMTPDNPTIRGTSQNPDVYFQARETVNPYYDRMPGIVIDCMNRFAELTGRRYQPYEYVGDPQAESVIILMGSGCETVHETVEHMNTHGRIVVCGMISMYNAIQPVPGPTNLAYIIGKQLTMQGFIVTDHFDKIQQFYADMGKWIAEGKIKWKETVMDGIENAPKAFTGIFKGENFGKMIVKIGSDPGN